ncbi:NUDIX hydrolase [Paenibacillus sp. J45TS6]|uniref:NUDIX hydrolase n=1 Tax=Paenibacillus sp. J45TS6 TaxID=2807196 RepID=UPI001B10C149|nr:NUDIX hydrolase [Paenibacillus sp. J45TS6]GIP43036.1 NUDIX hydrolase [Paenibacillus sp. J45TS6]
MQMPTHIVAAGGIVEDENEQILLVKTFHGGWVFPGGQVEVGENLMDGLRREVEEESGISTQVMQLIGVYSNTGIYKWHDGITDVPTKVMFDFICKPVGGELRTSDETSEVKWVKKDKVLDYITSGAIRARYEVYLEYKGTVRYMEYVTKPDFIVKESRDI